MSDFNVVSLAGRIGPAVVANGEAGSSEVAEDFWPTDLHSSQSEPSNDEHLKTGTVSLARSDFPEVGSPERHVQAPSTLIGNEDSPLISLYSTILYNDTFGTSAHSGAFGGPPQQNVSGDYVQLSPDARLSAEANQAEALRTLTSPRLETVDDSPAVFDETALSSSLFARNASLPARVGSFESGSSEDRDSPEQKRQEKLPSISSSLSVYEARPDVLVRSQSTPPTIGIEGVGSGLPENTALADTLNAPVETFEPARIELLTLSAEQRLPPSTSGKVERLSADVGAPIRLASIIDRGDGEFEVRLDPPDLGSITLQFFESESAGLRALVFADRADTLELLRRHIDILHRELARSGLENVEFSFRDRRDDDKPADDPRSAPHRIYAETGDAFVITADARSARASTDNLVDLLA